MKISDFLSIIILTLGLSFSCDSSKSTLKNTDFSEKLSYIKLPERPGPRQETTPDIPHIQIGIEPVPEIRKELIRRVYSIKGLEEGESAVLTWKGLHLKENMKMANPQARLSGQEIGHIHEDSSLHIFLEPSRAKEAIERGWAIDHPWATQGRIGYDGFVMLYTPLNLDELDVTFQLIVDSFNYVTGQNREAKDYH